MKYDYLEQDYIDDVIADALHARETEHFHYALDLANFEFIVKNTNDPKLILDMQERIATINGHIYVVQKVYDALQTQITDPARHAAAVARSAAKRARDAEKPAKEKR